MRTWIKTSLLILILLMLIGAVGLMALPQVVAAVPASYRHRLPEPLLDLVTTPLPAALPAPEQRPPGQAREINVPALRPSPAAFELPPTPPIATPVAALVETAVATPTALLTPTPAPTATPLPTATATPDPPPPAARIDGLRIIAQGFNNCGPATLTVNLNFHGIAARQPDVATILKPNPDDRNVTPEEMRDYVLNLTDLGASVHRGGDLDLLKRFLAAGFPVIIEKGYEPGGNLGWMGHYLTLFAYDDSRQEILAIDTYLGPWDSSGYRYTYDQINHFWSHFNNAFIIIYPTEQEAIVQQILGPDLLDETSMWQNVALAAHTETRRDSENAFAWFNLGSSLTHLGSLTGNDDYYEMAAASFDRAREIGLPPRMLWYQFDPYVAYLETGRAEDVFTLTQAILAYEGGRGVEETYYYRAQAYLAVGDVAAARNDLRRAVQLNSNYDLAREALQALED